MIKDIIAMYQVKYADQEGRRKVIRDKIEKKQNQIEKITAQIDGLENRLYKIAHVSWIDEIIEPIAKAMTEQLPDRHYEVLGPFGLCARVSIHFYRDEITGQSRWKGDNTLSITFDPADLNAGDIQIVDYETNTGRFAKGTLGEVNGMNYPTIPMPETIEGLIALMMEQNKKEANTNA